MRIATYFAALVMLFLSTPSLAITCTQSGKSGSPVGHAPFAFSADAMAFCQSQAGTYLVLSASDGSQSQTTTYGNCTLVQSSNVVTLSLLSDDTETLDVTVCDSSVSHYNLVLYNYTYTTLSPQCPTGTSTSLTSYTTSQSGLDEGSSVCKDGCATTWNPSSAPVWDIAKQMYKQSGSLTTTGASCSTGTNPGQLPPPPSSTPPPNNPQPPPTPPPTPPSSNPPPPPAPNPATGDDVNNLGQLLGKKLDDLLSGETSLYNAINASADKIVSAINAKPTSSTDMTTTNNQLAQANGTLGTISGKLDGLQPGANGSQPGHFYTTNGRTISDSVSDYKAAVANAPIVQAGQQFFTVTGGGSCPTFTLAATDWWPAMVFDYQCRSPMSDVFALAGYLVLAIGAWSAFKIAIY